MRSPSSRKRGAALVATLSILVICMLLLTFGFRMVLFHKAWALKEMHAFQAQLAAESGIDYARSRLTGIARQQAVLALNGFSQTMDERQSFKLEVAFKFGYVWVRATGFRGTRQHVAEALLGSEPYPESQAALIVGESRFELYASGDSHIRGNIVVPNGRVIPRAMHRLPAAANPLVEGRILQTEPSTLPRIRPLITDQARLALLEADTMQVGIARVPDRAIWNLEGGTFKFDHDLVIPEWVERIQGPGTILIRGDLVMPYRLSVTGNAWLVAKGKVQARGDLELAATLIAGTSLTLDGPVSGHAVLLARESLTLSQHARLGWPSQAGLVRVPEMGGTGFNYLRLDGAVFHGTLFAWDERSWQIPLIKIESGTRVAGYIFTTGRLELNAPFRGHIFTQSLQASEGAQTFDNWLKNIRIDRAAESVNWAMPPGFGTQVSVLKWIRR